VTTVRPATRRLRTIPAGPAERQGPRGRRHSENLPGYVFLSPWLLGLFAITAIPMLLSLYLSFTDYDVLTPLSEANWVGWDNYQRMFTADPSYWHAVAVTCTFAFVLRSVSTSEGPASQMKSLWPVRNAAMRVAASGVERITYSSR